MIKKPKKPTRPAKPVIVKEKKADIFLGTKEDTAKGKYKSSKGVNAAKEIRKAMGK